MRHLDQWDLCSATKIVFLRKEKGAIMMSVMLLLSGHALFSLKNGLALLLKFQPCSLSKVFFLVEKKSFGQAKSFDTLIKEKYILKKK